MLLFLCILNYYIQKIYEQNVSIYKQMKNQETKEIAEKKG